jgi:hypothetical protein
MEWGRLPAWCWPRGEEAGGGDKAVGNGTRGVGGCGTGGTCCAGSTVRAAAGVDMTQIGASVCGAAFRGGSRPPRPPRPPILAVVADAATGTRARGAGRYRGVSDVSGGRGGVVYGGDNRHAMPTRETNSLLHFTCRIGC